MNIYGLCSLATMIVMMMMMMIDSVQIFRLHIGERRVESGSHPRHDASGPGGHAAVRWTGRLRRSSASQTVHTRQTREHDRCVAVAELRFLLPAFFSPLPWSI